MIYIDPSEIRSNSKALFLLDEFGDDIQPLEIEKRTGADMMISPSGLPHPTTDFLFDDHIQSGCTLVQNKFGHDFVSSVIDGRVKESQARMKLIGAVSRQRYLWAIGKFESDESDGLLIDGRGVFTKRPFTFGQYQAAVSMWIKRGGHFMAIPKNQLVAWIKAEQKVIDEVKDNPQRIIYLKSPALYEEELPEFDNDDFIEREWQAAQDLTLITDWRNLLNTLPGIADRKIRVITQYMEDNDIERNWYSFINLLENGKLIEIAGIGSGIERNIKKFLENKQ